MLFRSNQHYLKTSDPQHVARHLSWHLGKLGIDPAVGGPALVNVVLAQRERAKTLVEMAKNSVFFYQDFDDYDPKAAAKHLKPEVASAVADLRQRLAVLTPWIPEAIHEVVHATAAAHGLDLGKLAQPLRVMISGCGVSPPIDVTLALVGQERVLNRLDRGLVYLRR